MLSGPDTNLGPRSDLQFVENVFDVGRGSPTGYQQVYADLAVTQPQRDESRDFAFSGCEHVLAGYRCGRLW